MSESQRARDAARLAPESLARATVSRDEIFRVTLCGSTKFRDEFELWNKRLTLAGFLVYSVCGFGHSGDAFTDGEKARLDQIHLAKIDASHAIVVLNVGGYIGDSTRREIDHAKAAGKEVYYLEGDNIVYRLRTGPDGASSLRYRAFEWGGAAPAPARTRGMSAGERAFTAWAGSSKADATPLMWTWAEMPESQRSRWDRIAAAALSAQPPEPSIGDAL